MSHLHQSKAVKQMLVLAVLVAALTTYSVVHGTNGEQLQAQAVIVQHANSVLGEPEPTQLVDPNFVIFPEPEVTVYCPSCQEPKAVTPLPTMPPAPTPVDTHAPILLQDTFSSEASINNYSIMDVAQPSDFQHSTWRTEDGLLKQMGDYSESAIDKETIAVTGDESMSYYEVAVQADGGRTPVGVVACYTSQGFYLLRAYPAPDIGESGGDAMSSVDSRGWILERYNLQTNTRTLMADGLPSAGYIQGQWSSLKIQVGLGTVAAYMNGNRIAVVQDSKYPSGKVGLYSEARYARFDNLVVSRLASSIPDR